jgi:UDP-N-acetyl-D-mannosaminuronic acid transferase (WecB/TagA/CpsF family)
MFRLIQEPGRLWKRYLLGNWIFIARVTTDRLRQHLSGKNS